jgi:hypothetical protein
MLAAPVTTGSSLTGSGSFPERFGFSGVFEKGLRRLQDLVTGPASLPLRRG